MIGTVAVVFQVLRGFYYKYNVKLVEWGSSGIYKGCFGVKLFWGTMIRRKLTVAQREFLHVVSEAAFVNPFGVGRAELDLSIAGIGRDAAPGDGLTSAIRRVDEFIASLDRPSPVALSEFNAEDSILVRDAILFWLFHRAVDPLDALIERQIKIGSGVCPVGGFARDVLGDLVRHGFAKSDALRMLAFFYQLRRAYYFISTALVGRSPSMRKLRMSLWNNVFTHDARLYGRLLWNRMEDFSSLIFGETGSGKGAAARAIGRSGYIPFDEPQGCFAESFMASLVEINLSQFPESLIESELFGHRKGAFTGAVEAHKGIFSLCSGHGAVFLDEIGDVSIPVQIKLLRVLQEREFTAVGSHEKQSFRGRVIAATNKNLDKLRQDGSFRDDFYYRLCSDSIRVPALRQRIREDAGELDDLLAVVVQRIVGRHDSELVAQMRDKLEDSVGLDYEWPGNVRELEQSVRRILLCGEYTGQTPRQARGVAGMQARIEAGDYDAQSLLSDYCTHIYEIHGTYEAVAKIAGLDRRTVRKYIVRSSAM